MAAIQDVVGDAIAIAIVCFVVNISMAKLFATKYKYQISPNQELFAYAVGNIVTAFFNGFPACVALSRCAVVEGTGGKTQVKKIKLKFEKIIVIIFKDCRIFGINCCINCYSSCWSGISYFTKFLFSSYYRHRYEEYAFTNQAITGFMAYK
jgi:hypothetical protein